MVMIVKDHEKQAHGFISVTRLAWRPADLRSVVYRATVARAAVNHRVIEHTRNWEQPSDHVPIVTEFAL